MINDHEKMNAGLVGTVSDRGGMINYQGGMTPDHGGTVSCHVGITILQRDMNNLRLVLIFLENSILFNQKMRKSAAN